MHSYVFFKFQGEQKNFTDVIKANIGDCHAVGQEPLTFLRQVGQYPPQWTNGVFALSLIFIINSIEYSGLEI